MFLSIREICLPGPKTAVFPKLGVTGAEKGTCDEPSPPKKRILGRISAYSAPRVLESYI